MSINFEQIQQSQSSYTYIKNGEQITVIYGQDAKRFTKFDKIDTRLKILAAISFAAALAFTITTMVFMLKNAEAEADAYNARANAKYMDRIHRIEQNLEFFPRSPSLREVLPQYRAHLAAAQYHDSLASFYNSLSKSFGYSSAAAGGLTVFSLGSAKIMKKIVNVHPDIEFGEYTTWDELREAMPKMYAAGARYMSDTALDNLRDKMIDRYRDLPKLKERREKLMVSKHENSEEIVEIEKQLGKYVPEELLKSAIEQDKLVKQ